MRRKQWETGILLPRKLQGGIHLVIKTEAEKRLYLFIVTEIVNYCNKSLAVLIATSEAEIRIWHGRL